MSKTLLIVTRGGLDETLRNQAIAVTEHSSCLKYAEKNLKLAKRNVMVTVTNGGEGLAKSVTDGYGGG